MIITIINKVNTGSDVSYKQTKDMWEILYVLCKLVIVRLADFVGRFFKITFNLNYYSIKAFDRKNWWVSSRLFECVFNSRLVILQILFSILVKLNSLNLDGKLVCASECVVWLNKRSCLGLPSSHIKY